MNEPRQLSLLENVPKCAIERRVEYCSPREEVVESFIQVVSHHLGEAGGNKLSTTEARQGFGGFLRMVISITTKQANERSAL